MTTSPATCDSSVLIPALSSRHPLHRSMRTVVAERVSAIPAHTMTEAFATLTRLPQEFRLPPQAALTLLRGLDMVPLALPADGHLDALESLVSAGIAGGPAYDGVIAMTARHHGYRLLSRDRRAERTYRAIGVDYEWLAP